LVKNTAVPSACTRPKKIGVLPLPLQKLDVLLEPELDEELLEEEPLEEEELELPAMAVKLPQ
jgi:hypothetical protein